MKMKQIISKLFCYCVFLYFLFLTSAYGGGITVITHGFNSGVTDWIKYMKSSINWRFVDQLEKTENRDVVGSELARINASYVIKITQTRNNLSISDYTFIGSYQGYYWGIKQISSVSMANSGSGEAVVLIDWSDLDFSGSQEFSTTDVAFLVRDALFSSDALFAFGCMPLSVPIHLVGHSRGGSLIGALAEYLAEFNIWIDHVTFLDPHPVFDLVHRDDWPKTDGDNLTMYVTDNVRFSDNYYRKGSWLVPNGETVQGAVNFELNNEFLEGGSFGGYYGALGDEHSDVHLWYQGTIDILDGITDGSATINSSQIGEWYKTENGMPSPRESVGYYYSRIVGGNRISVGLGLASPQTRTHIVEKETDSWPNLEASLNINALSDSKFEIGNNIKVYFQYQSLRECNIRLGLDNDSNPFNGSHYNSAFNRDATSDGNAFDNGQQEDFDIDTSNIPPGTYYLVAEISANGHKRYVHSAEQITLEQPSVSPDTNEPNNTYQEASDLGIIKGEYSASNLSIDSGDIDFYKFEIAEKGTENDYVEVHIQNDDNSGEGIHDLDLAIGKLNNENHWVPAIGGWYDSMSLSDTRIERYELEGLDPGKYYAIVFGASGYELGEDEPDFVGTEVSSYSLEMHGPIEESPVILPNLIINDFNLVPSPTNDIFYVGDSVSWMAIVQNIGEGSADESRVGYYIGTSPDDYIVKPGDDSSDSVDSLGPDQATAESSSYTFREADIGQRYLICLADNDSELDESQETDNKWVYGPFTVALPQAAPPPSHPQAEHSMNQYRWN